MALNRVVLVIILCGIAGASIFAYLHFMPKKDPGVDQFDAMYLSLPNSYIADLEKIITENPDPSIRSQGVITLTRIALERNETEMIMAFLRDTASKSTDERVQSAAYASLDFIRNQLPQPPRGSLMVEVSGPIRKGSDITVRASVSSVNDEEKVIVGIDVLSAGLQPLSTPRQETTLKAHETKQITFSIHILETGKQLIVLSMRSGSDLFDGEKIQKKVFLTVNENDGSYQIG